MLPKQLHGGLIDGRFVIFIFFLEFRYLRLNFLHPFHGFHALVSERDEKDFDKDREEDNIPTIVVSAWNLDPSDREAGVTKSQECDEIVGYNVQDLVITVKQGERKVVARGVQRLLLFGSQINGHVHFYRSTLWQGPPLRTLPRPQQLPPLKV